MKRTNPSLTFALAILVGAAVGCGGSSKKPDSGAGTVDSGTPDVGTPDSGIPDSGTPDSGTPDSGTPDSGTPDAGIPDAGSDDAGVDAGTDDGGIDAGTDDGGTDGGSDGGTVALDCATCHTAAHLSAAHSVHIVGGSASNPFPCSECHTLYTSASHTAGDPVVTFATGPNDIARTGGLSPSWDATAKTCSNVYCHGGDGTVVTGGNVPNPNWTIVDGSQARCTSCHGDPPTASSHVQCTKDFCNVCHLDAYQGGGIDPSTKLHVNGKLEVIPPSDWGKQGHGLDTPPPDHPASNLSTCDACHGSPPVGSAPVEKMTCLTCHDPIP